MVLLPGFCNKSKLFRFQIKDGMSMKLVLQASARGLPSLMLSLGVITRNYCFNFALDQYIGAAGVAVAGIMSTVSALTGAVPSGAGNAYSALAGIYFGEDDRESLLDLSHIAMRIGIALCAVTTGLIMIFSTPLAKLFLPQDEELQALAVRMFILTFTYLVTNVFLNILLQSYRAQNRMTLVNVMSFAETAIMGVFVLLTVRSFGSDAAWLCNTIVDLFCIVIVLISVFIYKKKIDLSMSSLLKLPDDFGAAEDQFMTFSVVKKEDLTTVSEKVIDFCSAHAYSAKTAYHVGLCIEEMAGNVLTFGFGSKSACYADVRIVSKDNVLTVRVRDNCKEFDPRKRIELYDSTHPEKNIGIHLVSEMAEQIDYYNNAGINTLIMKFS